MTVELASAELSGVAADLRRLDRALRIIASELPSEARERVLAELGARESVIAATSIEDAFRALEPAPEEK